MCFRGSAASLRPSAGGDSEESLCQPGNQPHHNNIQGQTSYHHWQDQGSQRSGEVKPSSDIIALHRPVKRKPSWHILPPSVSQVRSAACRGHHSVDRQDQHGALLTDGGHTAAGQHCWRCETGASPSQSEWTSCPAAGHRYVPEVIRDTATLCETGERESSELQWQMYLGVTQDTWWSKNNKHFHFWWFGVFFFENLLTLWTSTSKIHKFNIFVLHSKDVLSRPEWMFMPPLNEFCSLWVLKWHPHRVQKWKLYFKRTFQCWLQIMQLFKWGCYWY